MLLQMGNQFLLLEKFASLTLPRRFFIISWICPMHFRSHFLFAEYQFMYFSGVDVFGSNMYIYLNKALPTFSQSFDLAIIENGTSLLALNSRRRCLACQNFITSYIIIFYFCGICLLLEPRVVEVCRLQSWLHGDSC